MFTSTIFFLAISIQVLVIVVEANDTTNKVFSCIDKIKHSENIPHISINDFQTLDLKNPAIINIEDIEEWKSLTKAFSKENFIRDFGSTLVHTTTPFSTARYGPNSHDDGGRPMTVQHILNNHNRDTNGDQNNDDLMIFAGNNSRLHSLVFAEDLPANAWMQHQLHLLSAKDDKANNQPFRSYLSIARKSEGLTFHKHGDTFLTLVTGTKDWLIAPPETRPTANMIWTSSTRNYCSSSSHSDKIRRVTQKAGEIFYIPKEWWHATINMGNKASISIAKNVRDDLSKESIIDSKDERNYLFDGSTFEATEDHYFNTELHRLDELLHSNVMDRSHASTLRWTNSSQLWHQRLKRAINAYYIRTPSENARRPELCFYVVTVAIGSELNRIARESAENEKNTDDNSNDSITTGLTYHHRVLEHIHECETSLLNAASSGLLRTAALSASLIQLSDKLSDVTHLVRSKQQPENLASFAQLLTQEQFRLLHKAANVTSNVGEVSVKALWEIARVICEVSATSLNAETTECKKSLTNLFAVSHGHSWAYSLWQKMFPDENVPIIVGSSTPSSASSASMSFSDTATPGCVYTNLLELIAQKDNKDNNNKQKLANILQLCVKNLATEARYKWLNAKDKDTGQTAVMGAALNGNVEIVKLLCHTEGVDFEIGEKFGFDSYDGAAFNGHPDVLRLLIKDPSCSRNVDNATPIDQRPRWDRPSPVDGYTPLWRAVWGISHGHIEAVSVLLTEGNADVNFPCGIACTGPFDSMLEFAVAGDNIETVKLLLDGGAVVKETVKKQISKRFSQSTCFENYEEFRCKYEWHNIFKDRTNEEVELEAWEEWEDGENAEDNGDTWIEDAEIIMDGDVMQED